MDALNIALEFIAVGWRPLPVAYLGKAPTDASGRKIRRWNTLCITRDNAASHFPPNVKLNVGVLLGPVSGNLADVDLDCAEARALACSFLTPTRTFGRPSSPQSHWLFTVTDSAVNTLVIRDADKKADVLLELRWEGAQTVMPGSVHESTEPITWDDADRSVTEISGADLMSAVKALGAAVLIARHLPPGPLRAPALFSLAAALLGAEWESDRAWRFVAAIASVSAPHITVDLDGVSPSSTFDEIAGFMSEPVARRALASALGLLGLSLTPPSNEASPAPEDGPEIALIPVTRRCEVATRYLLKCSPNANADGSAQLVHLCAIIARGFALGPTEAQKLVWQHFVVRHSLPWSETELYARVRDGMNGPNGGTPIKWGSKLLDAVPRTASEVAAALVVGPDGRVSAGTTNVLTILSRDPRWVGVLQYDAFREALIVTRTPPARECDAPAARSSGDEWSEEDDVRTLAWVREEYEFEPRKGAVADAVGTIAQCTIVHPVREYLAALNWDGVERLPDLFTKYFGAEPSAYVRGIGVRWLISAVARVMVPGCQVDYLPILEGPQAIGKTTGLARLMPNPSWFAYTGVTIGNKDSYLNLRGKLIYCFDELDAIRGNEITKTKNFLSSAVDTYRPPYARRSRDFPRQVVFAGTTNEAHYLRDRTGNRRFWPVRCTVVDLDAIERDRDQLWAEAAARYARNEEWWPDAALAALCAEQQAERLIGDPWIEPVAEWLAGVERGAVRGINPETGVTTAEILKQCLCIEIGHSDRNHETRMGYLLRDLGYVRGRQQREDGRVVRRYVKAWRRKLKGSGDGGDRGGDGQ